MAHKASQLFEDCLFDGDVNAIVDFKYSANPKLTWWFDHHQSAFLSPEDEEHYRARHLRPEVPRRQYQVLHQVHRHGRREKFGYEAPDLAELVQWADIVDGAQYASAEEAVDLRSAAMQLVLVIEGVESSGQVQQIIRWMQREPA